MNEKNSVRLEGVLRRAPGVRRGFEGELTTLFLQVPTLRGHMHIQAVARLPKEARERLKEGSCVSVEGELDYEKKKNGGFEVFVVARRIHLVQEEPRKEDEGFAEFNF
jgi:aspartyl/asparaginyl-tRNA synthetase